MLLLIVGLFVVSVAVVASISRRHAMGLLLFILFSHGIFVFFLGVETAQHLPLFASICVFAILLLKGKYVLPSFIAVWLFMLFLSIMVLSTVTGGGTDHSLLKLVFYLKPICLAFIVACLIRTLKDIDVVASYIIAGAFLGSMFNLYQKIFGTYLNKNIWDSSLSRAAGLRGDPNDTAMLLVMSLPVFYYKILDAKSIKQRYFLIMAVLLTLVG
ncbi:MAG: hypothetical protein JZU65_20910, partial [Chlorobium sp.]|nr:hypothetical protein [Chlorobium sp.]